MQSDARIGYLSDDMYLISSIYSIGFADNSRCKRMFKLPFPYKYYIDCITAVSI